MRRSDREITNIGEIMKIMDECDSCTLALYSQDYPYIIPMNFGYTYTGETLNLYFHSASAGTKLELIKQNNKAAFAMDTGHHLMLEDVSCMSTMEYESVCGNGTVSILSAEEKVDGLTAIMGQYQKNKTPVFDAAEVKAVTIMRLKVDNISGKRLHKVRK